MSTVGNTETSRLGLTEQARKLMDPRPAKSEAEISERVEEWEEKCSRLVRYGSDYSLPAMFRKVAVNKLLTGKAVDSFERWDAEGWKYEDVFKKVKEYARSRKLDNNAKNDGQNSDLLTSVNHLAIILCI